MKNEWKKAQNALIDAKMNELAECKAQLAALRAAAEQMAERLRALRTYQRVSQELCDILTADRIFVEEDAAALEAWEQVSK
jgi:hypothetical protein